MRKRRLSTTSDVFDALGIDAIMALTSGKYTAVQNWKQSGHFPAKTYVALTSALAAIGAEAPDSLWQMIEVDPATMAGVVQRLSPAHGVEVQP
jgi:hypothetical protein